MIWRVGDVAQQSISGSTWTRRSMQAAPPRCGSGCAVGLSGSCCTTSLMQASRASSRFRTAFAHNPTTAAAARTVVPTTQQQQQQQHELLCPVCEKAHFRTAVRPGGKRETRPHLVRRALLLSFNALSWIRPASHCFPLQHQHDCGGRAELVLPAHLPRIAAHLSFFPFLRP